jgi:hypothetical protein
MAWKKRTMRGECAGEVGVYRFFNMIASRHGEPFSLCETHRSQQVVPEACTLEQLALKSLRPCEREGRASESA